MLTERVALIAAVSIAIAGCQGLDGPQDPVSQQADQPSAEFQRVEAPALNDRQADAEVAVSRAQEYDLERRDSGIEGELTGEGIIELAGPDNSWPILTAQGTSNLPDGAVLDLTIADSAGGHPVRLAPVVWD